MSQGLSASPLFFVCLLYCWFSKSNQYPPPLSALPTNPLQFRPPIRAATLFLSLSLSLSCKQWLWQCCILHDSGTSIWKWHNKTFYLYTLILNNKRCYQKKTHHSGEYFNGKRWRPLTKKKKKEVENRIAFCFHIGGGGKWLCNWALDLCSLPLERDWKGVNTFLLKWLQPVKVHWVIHPNLNGIYCCLKAPIWSLPRNRFMQEWDNKGVTRWTQPRSAERKPRT